MNKPVKKTKLAIVSESKSDGMVTFDTAPELADLCGNYGYVQRSPNIPQRWFLLVDKRYDYDEVLNYMKYLGDSPST